MPILYDGESPLDEKQMRILDKIVELEGKCLDSKLCTLCPFKEICLPLFVFSETRLTRQERLSMALDTMARVQLMGDTELVSGIHRL